MDKKAEEDYKKEKIDYYNQKQPGKGERWAEKWANSRPMTYEPMFEELINKKFDIRKNGCNGRKKTKRCKVHYSGKNNNVGTWFYLSILKSKPLLRF